MPKSILPNEQKQFWGYLRAGFRGDPRDPGPGPPPKRAPHHVHVFSHMYDMRATLSFLFARKVFVDAIKLSVVQSAVFHLCII